MAVEALGGSLSEHRRIVKRDKEVHQAQKSGGNDKKSDPSKSKQGGRSQDGSHGGNNGGNNGGGHSGGSSNSDSNDGDNAPAPAPGPSVGLTPPPTTTTPAPAPAPVAEGQACPSGSAIGSYAGCTDRMTILTCSNDNGPAVLVSATCPGATCCSANPPSCPMTNNPSTVCYGSG